MSADTQTVTISQEEYEELKTTAAKLDALEEAGVDNWEWYGEAMSRFYGEDDEDDTDPHGDKV